MSRFVSTFTPGLEPSRRLIRGTALAMCLIGVLVLVGGLVLVQSLTSDLRVMVTATGEAVDTIEDSVSFAAELAEGATEAMGSASDAAADAASATEIASGGMTELASFLEDDLAQNVEAIQQALPGAIGAAGAIDSTLGALSFFGLDYSPEEPFADSMRRIQSALDELPDGIREQSEALDRVGPAAGDMATGVAALAEDLDELTVTMSQIDQLAERYSASVTEAQLAVTETVASLDRTTFLLRLIVVLAAIGAVLVGVSLFSVDRVLGLLASERPLPGLVVVGGGAAAESE